jgi:hypothetical protein
MQVHLFFDALQSNAVLLVDPRAILFEDIHCAIEKLGIKFRQRLMVHLTELRKDLRQKRNRRTVVKVDQSKYGMDQNYDSLQKCLEVAKASGADAVFLSEEEIGIVSQNGVDVQVERMSEYYDTKFEEKRRAFVEGLPSLDKMQPKEFDDLVVRATRFSKWLRIYDKQIGKSSSPNTFDNFGRGLERILRLWIQHCHFSPDFFEIITVSESRHGGHETNRSVRKQLLKLGEKLEIENRVSIKQDENGIFHDRFFQTQTIPVELERGFDFQKKDGGMRRSWLKVAYDREEHLQECRNLPDSDE